MIGTRLAIVAAAALLSFGAPAGAQTLKTISGPAERPPASYTGKQYVDSRGCIFIRAGYGGAVTWVPRVDRTGKVMCNARPTVVQGAEPINPKTAAGERPKQGLGTAASQSAPKKVVKTQSAKPKVVTSAQTKAAPATPQAPKTKTVVVRKPAPAPAPKAAAPAAPAQNAGKPACDYGTASSSYVNNGSRYSVRCGPQQESPYGAPVIRAPGDDSQSYLSVPGAQPVTIPAGYEPVWTDDRLNPKRAVGTLNGAIAMRLVWTNTVPRRLIDGATGRDVTLRYAYLIYPYTNYAQQKAALSRKGVKVETVTVSTAPGYTVTRSTKSPATKTAPRVSTKTEPQAKLATGKPGYVRIGTFLDAAQKDRAVARLRGMGLPVKVGKTKAKGKPATILVVGPYKAGSDLNGLLLRIRAAGFPAAKIRN